MQITRLISTLHEREPLQVGSALPGRKERSRPIGVPVSKDTLLWRQIIPDRLQKTERLKGCVILTFGAFFRCLSAQCMLRMLAQIALLATRMCEQCTHTRTALA